MNYLVKWKSEPLHHTHAEMYTATQAEQVCFQKKQKCTGHASGKSQYIPQRAFITVLPLCSLRYTGSAVDSCNELRIMCSSVASTTYTWKWSSKEMEMVISRILPTITRTLFTKSISLSCKNCWWERSRTSLTITHPALYVLASILTAFTENIQVLLRLFWMTYSLAVSDRCS